MGGDAQLLRAPQSQAQQWTECGGGLRFGPNNARQVRLAEDIDFKYPMKKACKKEMEVFCKGIEHGHARVISCLQEKVEDSEMSEECRAEVSERDTLFANHSSDSPATPNDPFRAHRAATCH